MKMPPVRPARPARISRDIATMTSERVLISAVAVAEYSTSVDEARGMWREAKQLSRRAAHGLEVDHFQTDQRRARAISHDIPVAGDLRRVVVDIEQATAATGRDDHRVRGVGDERVAPVVEAPRPHDTMG